MKNRYKICIFDKKAVSLHRELIWAYRRVSELPTLKRKNEYETTKRYMMQRDFKPTFQLILRSIFAGICIGIAGWGFLANKTIGMFLFIFGLATVVSYQEKLLTGMAGYVGSKQDLLELILYIFPGNLVGCLLIALMTKFTPLPIHEAATAVLQSRLSTGPLGCGVLAIGCGILMTSAVNFAKKGKDFGYWVPLLFAVPLFIHCGFPHCIADAFYYLTAFDFILENPSVLVCYAASVLGNFIGCNIPRIFVWENQ